LSLEAPIERVCGYDTPFPLAFEKVPPPPLSPLSLSLSLSHLILSNTYRICTNSWRRSSELSISKSDCGTEGRRCGEGPLRWSERES
jgi:hypothetical protein